MHLGSLSIAFKLSRGCEPAGRGWVPPTFHHEPVAASCSISALLRKEENLTLLCPQSTSIYTMSLGRNCPTASVTLLVKGAFCCLVTSMCALSLPGLIFQHLMSFPCSVGSSNPPWHTGARHLLPPAHVDSMPFNPVLYYHFLHLTEAKGPSEVRQASSKLQHVSISSLSIRRIKPGLSY